MNKILFFGIYSVICDVFYGVEFFVKMNGERVQRPDRRFWPKHLLESSSHNSLVMIVNTRCFDQGTSGVHHWLVLNPTSGTDSGYFSWTDVRSVGVSTIHLQRVLIYAMESSLYFTTKGQKSLFILDLDAGSYTWQSTNQGIF